MDFYWLEQTAANVPQGETWLSTAEVNHLRTLRFPKRRADWLLGRWTAKNAVALVLHLPTETQVLRDIEIRPAPSGAPEVFLQNQPAPVTISLSHRAGVAACALAQSGSFIGCDLEIVEPHGDTFAADYFTLEEQTFIAQSVAEDRLRLLALHWSAKESALKALREGLRLDTRHVVVSLPGLRNNLAHENADSAPNANFAKSTSQQPVVWHPLQVNVTDGQTFGGWWNQSGELLRTVLGLPPVARPFLLSLRPETTCVSGQ